MGKKRVCPQCQMEIFDQNMNRCPRCFKILAQHSTCNGCGKCSNGSRLKDNLKIDKN